MKIGIFGDSFADDYTIWTQHFTDVGPSWIDVLREQDILIENHAAGGSGLYYSYEKFICNFEKYDKIVFAVTNPGRIYLSHNGNYGHWHSLSQVEMKLKQCVEYEEKIKLTAVHDYFKYVKNEKYDNLVHDLMIEHMIEKHQCILMIPSFEYSRIQNKLPLSAVTEFEAAFWKLPTAFFGLNTMWADARKCHMCEENNLMFGHEVLNWVRNGQFNFDAKKFKTPTRPREHYFRKPTWN
jgi:hypothetical protein